MSKPIRILIADDHSIVRIGLATLLQCHPEFKVIGEADDGESAVSQAIALKPDVVIMDLMMPGIDGAEATRRILSEFPRTPTAPTPPTILLLTSFGTSADISRAVAAGASGAIVKDSSNDLLLDAIRRIHAGEKVFSPEIEQFLATEEETPQLTKRQLEILESVTRGLTNDDIAIQFGISKNMVKHHLTAIFAKLGAASRSEAIVIALRKRLLKI